MIKNINPLYLKRWTSICIVFSISLGFLLFNLKNKVAAIEKSLRITKNKIIQEKESIHILKAEWGYLNNPARLQKLNDQFLHLTPFKTQRIITKEKLPSPEQLREPIKEKSHD